MIDEVIEITPRALELARKITTALGAEGPGGRKITRAERKAILADAWELAGLILRWAL